MALTSFKAYHRFTLAIYLALIAANVFAIDKSVLLPDLIPVAYIVAESPIDGQIEGPAREAQEDNVSVVTPSGPTF